MSVRQLRELSAQRFLGCTHSSDRRVSSCDGDDSRPVSPDKQIKVPARSAKAGSAASSTAVKQRQQQHSTNRLPQQPQKPAQQKQQSTARPRPSHLVHTVVSRRSGPELPNHRHPSTSKASAPQGRCIRAPASARTASPVAAGAVVTQTAGKATPHHTQLQDVAASSSSSSDGDTVSTESSCSSGISPHNQLLLSAVVDSLHQQQQHHQQQPLLLQQASSHQDSGCSWPMPGVHDDAHCTASTAQSARHSPGANATADLATGDEHTTLQLCSSRPHQCCSNASSTSSSTDSSDDRSRSTLTQQAQAYCSQQPVVSPANADHVAQQQELCVSTCPSGPSAQRHWPSPQELPNSLQQQQQQQRLSTSVLGVQAEDASGAAAAAAAAAVLAATLNTSNKVGRLQQQQQQQQGEAQPDHQQQEADLSKAVAVQAGSGQQGFFNTQPQHISDCIQQHRSNTHRPCQVDHPIASSSSSSRSDSGSAPPGVINTETSKAAAASSTQDAAADTAARGTSVGLLSQQPSCDVSAAEVSAVASLTASEFEAISRDVAARIIQAHWHLYKQQQLEQQQQQQPPWQQQQQSGSLHHQEVPQHAQQQDQEEEQEQQVSLQPVISTHPQTGHMATQSSCSSSNCADAFQHVRAQAPTNKPPASEHQQQSLQVDQQAQQQQQPATSALPTTHHTSGAVLACGQVAEAEAAVVGSVVKEGSSCGPAAPQTAAPALEKLRAAAGSRNAVRLQHYKVSSNATQPILATPPADASLAHLSIRTEVNEIPDAAALAVAAVGFGGTEQVSAAAESYTTAAVAATEQDCCGDLFSAGRLSSGQHVGIAGPADSGSCSSQQPITYAGGSDKLSIILAYLDEVEAHAGHGAEPGAVPLDVGWHGRSAGRPGTSCLPAATRPLMSNAARPLSAQFRTSNHQHIMQLPGQHHHLQQAEQHPVLLWDGAILQQDEPTQVQRPFSATTCVEAVPGAETSQPGADPLAALSITSAGVAGAVRPSLAPSRPAVLAESVFDGVKAKMRNLRAALADKESMLQAMTQDVEAMREAHQKQLQQLAHSHQQQLSGAASEASATLSRHLGLIDRLMEEKTRLAAKLEDAHQAAAAAQEGHNAAMSALKQGWAAELKCQAASWEAAAAAKQEAWRVDKVAEIKEQTVKGLEVEVQRLINRHRADLEAAHERAADQVQQALDAAKVDHDAQLQALKERLKRQQDQALEREHAAAACRLREASERWEGQLQATRMRLMAENDIKLEAAAAATQEEKRKGEAALEAAEARFASREALLKEEWQREKEAIARSHTRALEAAKQAAADERSAWRAAVTESLKRQAADREEKLRAELLKQRDQQLQVVIRRLDAEGAAARAAAADKVAAEHAAVLTALQEQLQQSQKGAKRLAERGKAAAAAAAAAERDKLELQQMLDQARQELTNQHQALAASKAALSSKESEMAAAAATAAATAASNMQQLLGDKARLEGRLQELQGQLKQQQERHQAEMQHVELRVKGAIARRDETIVQLQQELAVAVEALRGTEAVLAAQQEELCD